ncbi:MAG: NAD-glutamate dehydrogenase domain-containing protein, partial [Desulfovibrionaceae bacterium]
MADTDASARGRVLTSVLQDIENEASGVVGWFYEQMPDYYFLSHEEQDVRRHLRALLSGQVLEEGQELVLSGPGPGKLTYLTPGGDMRRLVAVLEQLRDQDIQTARIYETRDRKLRLDTFLMAPQCASDATSDAFQSIMEGMAENPELNKEDLEAFREFLACASQDYVRKFEPRRAVRHFSMWRDIQGTERVHVRQEPADTPGLERILVAMTHPPRTELLLMAARIFARAGLNVERAYGDVFGVCIGREAAILTFYLRKEEQGLTPDSELWEKVTQELSWLKWFAPHALEAFAEEEGSSLAEVMLIQAACEFTHQHLQRSDMYAYTSDRIVRAALKHRDVVRVLLDYFRARFRPDAGQDRAGEMRQARDAAREAIAGINSEVTRSVFGCMLRFFHYTQRANYYMPRRFGLAFRLDPAMFADIPREQRPYGVYFFHGPFSLGFHVRYRDMSRGGVRMVPAKTQERFEIESNRLFDEVVKLASAQQYKNKDIPEGGSKAVLLLGPKADRNISISCMVDGLLDLIATDEAGAPPPEVVDYLGREEIIYLGPDENVTPAHIEWIVERAKRRGYRWPCALMSSKPKTGINHKEYGVTSEGVVVFADQALQSLGINPRTHPFTVKLTGGPAGDVASNCMRILRREFGDNARIVAMADGHGAAYDPEGLDHDELARLIQETGHADGFDEKRLKGDGAFVVSASTAEGARVRDELHNRAKADLFIPAGGRPDTINDRNWRLFLDAEGRPSAR